MSMKLADCRYGAMLYNTNDEYVGRSLALYGEFSEGEAALFKMWLEPGDVALDVGANIGCHTVAMAQFVNDGQKAGVIYAFEAQRLVLQVLCANVAINGILNVHTIHAAVGAKNGLTKVPELDPREPMNFGGCDIRQCSDGTETPLVTIDSLALKRCKLIKVDVEGMEIDVIKGASKTIRKHKPLLYVENDRAENSVTLVRLIKSFGYQVWDHKPPLYNPDNFKKEMVNHFRRGNTIIVSHNLVCIHKDTQIRRPEGGGI